LKLISFETTAADLAGAVQLSCLESAQAIVFTLFVVVTGMDTSSQLETVSIYTAIPIWILFYDLNRSG